MIPGSEAEHLRSLLKGATYRGTDIRHFAAVDCEDQSTMHEIPYLAMAWEWKTILAFPWREEGHISELKLNAVAVFRRRRARFKNSQNTRFLHVLDSMVTRGCLAKGRSSSKRFSQVLRRCSAPSTMDGESVEFRRQAEPSP